ncbi:hypothetical protein D9758_000851 [Tetrapyrgos nigripes]|uniref:F-box domain-containing protein n=1 Tax=Tetrapyrgos nigripes TaxID=182062 RepID=A0A8H5GZ65_9AGAR|nr:hypothetical protein D9758_000851 [Tetrapyrgos nigripes]
MSSYTDPTEDRTTIFTLPTEIIDQILCSCALYDFPEAIAALSQTCQYFRNLIYSQDSDTNGTAGCGGHLWREVFLTTFDDPRHVLQAMKMPSNQKDEHSFAFDWRMEFQRRIQARAMFRPSALLNTKTVSEPALLAPALLAQSLKAIASIISGSLPSFPVNEDSDLVETVPKSSNLAWMNRLLSNGYPLLLTHKLLGRSPLPLAASRSQQDDCGILEVGWDVSDPGQTFYKIVAQSGFRPLVPTPASKVASTSEPLFSNLDVDNTSYPGTTSFGEPRRSSQTESTISRPVLLSAERQRQMARVNARRRVYNLSFLSQDRLWGPFLPYSENPSPSDVQRKSKAKEKVFSEDGRGKSVALKDGGKDKAATATESEDTDARHGLCETEDAGPSHVAGGEVKHRSIETEEFEVTSLEVADADNAESSGFNMTPREMVPAGVMRAIVTNFGVFFQDSMFEGEDPDQDQDYEIAADRETEDDDDDDGHTHNLILNLFDFIDHDADENGEGDLDYEPQDEDEESEEAELDEDDFATALFNGPVHEPQTRSQDPLHPTFPHLIKPDWAFLASARLIVEENLRERYKEAKADLDRVHFGGNDNTTMPPGWPWFTSVAAIEGTRAFLEMVGLADDGQTSDEGTSPAAADDRDERRCRGLESLRMGTMPGFWNGWNRSEAESDQVHDEGFSTAEQAADEDKVDGFDWANVSGGIWLRAVCWMDYRDLLFHNLRINRPTAQAASIHRDIEDIQETCRVFSITLRITGYERVKSPLSLPSASTNTLSSSVVHGQSSRDKGKKKASDTQSNVMADYDPLVYLLPVIHFAGEFVGSDVDASTRRRARGTVRMIGQGAVRWNMISSEGGTPDRDEWTMEGVQIGGVGSALGYVGLWTGASHERADPIGPTWAWKVK